MPVSSQRTLVRVQEKGQVTIPASGRGWLGIKTGDLVALEETAEHSRQHPAGVTGVEGAILDEDSRESIESRLIHRTCSSSAWRRHHR
jgi:AbrB family looped-hinge helix DNA binding protein